MSIITKQSSKVKRKQQIEDILNRFKLEEEDLLNEKVADPVDELFSVDNSPLIMCDICEEYIHTEDAIFDGPTVLCYECNEVSNESNDEYDFPEDPYNEFIGDPKLIGNPGVIGNPATAAYRYHAASLNWTKYYDGTTSTLKIKDAKVKDVEED